MIINIRAALIRGGALVTAAQIGQSTGTISPATAAAAAAPQPAARPAIDPIALEPVDEIVITTLVDNVYDALLTDDGRTTRAPFSIGPGQAPQFEAGSTTVGLMAEHGFSVLGSVRGGTTTTTLLVDTGLSPGAMITHADRPGVGLS